MDIKGYQWDVLDYIVGICDGIFYGDIMEHRTNNRAGWLYVVVSIHDTMYDDLTNIRASAEEAIGQKGSIPMWGCRST